ncbi:hypothetical protein cyc_06998 [Cyclospora cayetanensis]|uniref:Uncharacterized protein n=1 Tax=Cyclospora cayetanensis TaxID=88456 RepID=A0A1D3D882_9EIME|nr:hypothetical protein cyc_06998 [Cyclospora cayetanensis]
MQRKHREQQTESFQRSQGRLQQAEFPRQLLSRRARRAVLWGTPVSVHLQKQQQLSRLLPYRLQRLELQQSLSGERRLSP